MRKTLSLLLLIAFLGFAIPAQAQFRTDVNEQRAPSRLYNTEAANFLLNTVFNPAHFKMSHTYEMSIGGSQYGTSSLGMYTNTMAWQFNDKLAARVDMSAAYSPFNTGGFGQGEQKPQVFLRNAEVAYRPMKNMQIHLQIRQNPYGAYASPYGYYNPGYGYGYRDAGYHMGPSSDLFWKDSAR
jgi:hypothetical protein